MATWPFRFTATLLAAVIASCLPSRSLRADEGGVSFWLPGLFGSLAAAPAIPGPSFTTLYYHSSVSAGGGKNFVLGGGVVAGVNARADIVAFGPTYTFATPVLGGQASISLLGLAGHPLATVDATLTGPHGAVLTGSQSDDRTAFGDMLPQAALRWNFGVNNLMTYVTGDIPVGAYDVTRLANVGLGHGAIDAGGGYTYFDPKTGHEFSAVLGFTYNFENTAANYQNGVDMHLDWGASQFLSKQWQVGLVGYLYNQISPDTGTGATLGAFDSRVAGVGPQVGFIFPIGEHAQGYINVKGYKEFAAQNRPHGWNAWVTLVISPAPPWPPATQSLLFPSGH
jgi:hypothetical protein